jgi:hypothetical protein
MFATQDSYWTILNCLPGGYFLDIHSFSTGSAAFMSVTISILYFQSLIHSDNNLSAIHIWCISQVILRYFHLTTFFWMFLEGKQSHKLIVFGPNARCKGNFLDKEWKGLGRPNSTLQEHVNSSSNSILFSCWLG